MIVLKTALLVLFITTCQCRLPDKVKCVNENCSKPISKAKTLIKYNSGDSDLMSFPGNADAVIYMKSAGTNSDVWYATINGQSGFVSSQFLREYKIIAQPEFILPVEGDYKKPDVQPDKVQQPHEIFEGTTIFTTESTPATEEVTIPPTVASNENSIPLIPNEESNVEVSIENDQPSPALEQPQQIVEINEKVPIQTNIESFLNENLFNDSAETVDIPEQQSSFEEIIDPKPENDISTNDANSSLEASNNLDQTAQIASEQAINQDLKSSSDAPASNVIDDNTLNIQQQLSDNENVLVDIQVPDKIDYVEHDLSKSVASEDQNVMIPNIINNIDGALPTESPNIFNIVNNDNMITLTSEDMPKVPEVTEEIILNTETNIANNIRSVNGESITKQVNIQTEATTPPSVEETTSTPQPVQSTVSVPQTPIHSETIPAFNIPSINTYEDQNLSNQPAPTTQNIEVKTESLEKQDYTQESILETTKESIESSAASEIESDQQTTESIIEEIFNTATEAPSIEESSESVISSIYTTIADIWPSSTEAPPPESIFNPEFVQETVNDKSNTDSFSFVSYLLNTYSSVIGVKEQTNALFPSSGDTCFTDEYCDGVGVSKPNRLLTFLLTTAGSVLLLILGYYYIESKRQDGKLIGNINNLQRELLFSTKECEILKEELASTKSKLAGIEDSSFGMDDMVQSLKAEIQELKENNERLRNSLDDNEKLLRVSENTAGELQNTLGEVENTLSDLLAERAHSEEQIAEFNGKIQAFEEELISVSRERDNFQLKYVSAETALEEFKKQKKVFEEINQKLIEANNTIELQKHEIVALKDAIKELKSGASPNSDVTSLIDHTEIKAKLSKALEEKKSFMSKYEVEQKERIRLAEELKTTQESYKTSSQQASEAITRLEVLGKYFQERESELMKELNTKEALWLSKQGESTSTVEKIELLQQEVQRYKEKCDALTLELAEQESSRRTAIGEVETRAHAAWLEARAARRDADAARDDAAALRRKLAALHRTDGAVSPHAQVASPLEAEVGLPAGLPPPLAFLPPPLLPPLPRPPPLGRLPSPHPPRYSERRYSPDRRYSPESRYSPGSRYSPETVRYSPDSRYSPRPRRSPYSPRDRRRSRDRYSGRGSRTRNGPPDTETEYNSDSPTRRPPRRRYSRHSPGPSSGSGCSSESEK